MLNIAAERKKIEKVSGAIGRYPGEQVYHDTVIGIGNRYNVGAVPLDVLHSTKGVYINPDGTRTNKVLDPADQFFDTYNGAGYLHQQFPTMHVVVDNPTTSNAAGDAYKPCPCKKNPAKPCPCKANANGKPCPCKQGKPCPCKKSNADGVPDSYNDVNTQIETADQGVANIIASNEASQAALAGTTTVYWVIGALVVLGGIFAVWHFSKNKNKKPA